MLILRLLLLDFSFDQGQLIVVLPESHEVRNDLLLGSHYLLRNRSWHLHSVPGVVQVPLLIFRICFRLLVLLVLLQLMLEVLFLLVVLGAFRKDFVDGAELLVLEVA